MDREKLNMEAVQNQHRQWWTKHSHSTSFQRGADWLMRQPLSERLTEEEKENIIADYNEDVADDEYNDGYKAALRKVFGADLFK